MNLACQLNFQYLSIPLKTSKARITFYELGLNFAEMTLIASTCILSETYASTEIRLYIFTNLIPNSSFANDKKLQSVDKSFYFLLIKADAEQAVPSARHVPVLKLSFWNIVLCEIADFLIIN